MEGFVFITNYAYIYIMETILNCSQDIKDIICDSRKAYNAGKPHFYVYVHKIDNEIFYIGKGSHDRVIRTSGRSKRWYETAFGNNICVDIIAHSLIQSEALAKENELINLYKDCINKIFNKPVKIICFTREGEFIKTYDKINDVTKDGFKPSCVKQCCNKERGIHKNYIWMYNSEYQKTGFSYKKARNHSREIIQTRLDGEYVRTLRTAQAFALYGFDPKIIQQVCTHQKKTHLGNVFKYK